MGLGRDPARQALVLLAAACPQFPPGDLAHLPLGWRDTVLLALRTVLFGPRLEGLAGCPACGAQLELDFTAADVQSGPGVEEVLGRWAAATGPPSLQVREAGWEVTVRLPSTSDILALEAVPGGDASMGGRMLLERCVMAIRAPSDERPSPAGLPPEVLDAVDAAFLDADPQADVALSVTCPACGQGWTVPFDIASYLWSEVDDWARRTLRDVHTLAAAYGWPEADIVALSPARRQFYLSMVVGI